MMLISKEQFLIEHNRLSPLNLQATFALLTQFQEEKKPLLKDADWSIDRLRIPLISWLLALPIVEASAVGGVPSKGGKKAIRKSRAKQIFKNYPETKF